ncbi:MAG: protein kinase [Candidatus Obscuribacterales bacterium]|nr:protein kinase [Candidatus Obscuribacterales bacterium]
MEPEDKEFSIEEDKTPRAGPPPSAQDVSQEKTTSVGSRSKGEPMEIIADSLVGEILDSKYGIVKRLGIGGMSVVYQARDLSLGRNVAIKMMPLQSGHTRQDLPRFQQEAQTISRLKHPNLVTVFEFNVNNIPPYLVMEYIEGKSLAEVLASEGPLGLERGISVLRQMCSALTHAHENGVVHRDLKPANVLLQKNTEAVKIVDFGIAKIVQQDSADAQNFTRSGEILGSPLYMSPEQCQGKKLDHRSDIYSMGCVLYAIFVGSPPFQGPTAFETIQMHMHEQPVSISSRRRDLPYALELDSILFKAMAKEPSQRYQTIAELDEALSKIGLEDEMVGFGALKAMIDLNFSKAAAKKSRGMSVKLFWLVTVFSVGIGCIGLWHAQDRYFAEDSVKSWPEMDYNGQKSFDEGDYTRAETFFTLALKQAQRSNNLVRINASLEELIDLNMVLQNKQKVVEYQSQLVSSPEEVQSGLRTYRLVAMAQNSLDSIEKQMKILPPAGPQRSKQSLKLQRQLAVVLGDCRQLLVRKAENRQFTMIHGANAIRCQEILIAARKLCKQLTGEQHALYGRVLHTLALAYLATSQPDLAEKCFESAENLLKDSPAVSPLERADYLSDASHFFQLHGNSEKAVLALQKELELAGGAESNSIIAGSICFQLAELYNASGNFDLAEKYARLSQEILDKTQEKELGVTRSYLLVYMKDYKAALEPARKSLEESERNEVKDYWELTSLLTILATCYSHEPKTAPLAIPLLKRASVINLRCSEPFAYVRRLQKLAKVYSICGMQQEEVKTYEETLKQAVNLYGSRSPALATLYKDYASAQLQFGDKEGAERSLSKAVAILENGSSASSQMKEALTKLAEVVRLQGRQKEADEYAARAAGIKLGTGAVAPEYKLEAAPN